MSKYLRKYFVVTYNHHCGLTRVHLISLFSSNFFSLTDSHSYFYHNRQEECMRMKNITTSYFRRWKQEPWQKLRGKTAGAITRSAQSKFAASMDNSSTRQLATFFVLPSSSASSAYSKDGHNYYRTLHGQMRRILWKNSFPLIISWKVSTYLAAP